jgi:hypothetical protein
LKGEAMGLVRALFYRLIWLGTNPTPPVHNFSTGAPHP